MASDLSAFTRASLDGLSGTEREARLGALREAILARLAGAESHREFFETAGAIARELKQAGHDLWSWGYDGEAVEQWGGDYVRPDRAGRLLLEFTWPGGVRVSWHRWKRARCRVLRRGVAVAADSVVAYGELRGLLGAFAWVNHKTNHGYTFEFDRLPPGGTVGESVRLWLREHHELEARVTLKRLRGWRTPVRTLLERWLFSFVCDAHDGRFVDPHRHFSISERWVRRDVVGWVTDTLERAVSPTAAWRVEVEYGTRQFYECGWDDVAFESADGTYLLHLGVSD